MRRPVTSPRTPTATSVARKSASIGPLPSAAASTSSQSPCEIVTVARLWRSVDATTRKASNTNLSISVRSVSHHANLFLNWPSRPRVYHVGTVDPLSDSSGVRNRKYDKPGRPVGGELATRQLASATHPDDAMSQGRGAGLDTCHYVWPPPLVHHNVHVGPERAGDAPWVICPG